jgi:hypothetical protein
MRAIEWTPEIGRVRQESKMTIALWWLERYTQSFSDIVKGNSNKRPQGIQEHISFCLEECECSSLETNKGDL